MLDPLPTTLLGLGVGVCVGTLVAKLQARGSRRRTTAPTAEASALQRACDLLDEGVMLLDERDCVVYANPAARALVATAPVADDTVLPTLRELVIPEVAAALRQERGQGTVRKTLAGGGERSVEVTSGPLLSGRFVLVRDLEPHEKVDRKRRDFVANASHELKTPIATIVTVLELLDEDASEETSALLARARRAASMLDALAEDLLGLAKAEDAEWILRPERLSPLDIAREVAEEQRMSAESKGLALRVAGEAPAIVVDPQSLRTVINNLLQNAIAYTEAGEVVLALQATDDGVEMRVTDTGSGIDPEALPRIFERFYRGDPSRSRETGGTGLGLSIVRNLVRRMGGRVAVSSRQNAGTTFTIDLPANAARPLPGAGQGVAG